jgi:hypothetical protein
VNLEFAVSHASADVARYAGFAARIAASGSAPAAYAPAAQMLHAAAEVAPGAEVVPAGQLTQAAAPTVLLKLPAAHGAHAPPSGPVEPALHVQKPSPALTVLYNAVISAGVSTRLYI